MHARTKGNSIKEAPIASCCNAATIAKKKKKIMLGLTSAEREDGLLDCIEKSQIGYNLTFDGPYGSRPG